jgi:hydroxylamine reductase
MFCYQCQETVKNSGCTIKGVCGKTDDVATLQDLLIYLMKGISIWGTKARALGVQDDEVDRFVPESLFMTITNVNFDSARIADRIGAAFKMRDRIKNLFLDAYRKKSGCAFNETLHDSAVWHSSGDVSELIKKGSTVGILSTENEDIRSLRSIILFGLKGISAYYDHAAILGAADQGVLSFIQKALAATTDDSLTADELTGIALETGKTSVDVMALLDKANTSRYGDPEITRVYTGVKEGPGILVSGHDLLDLEELLKQTEGKGINIYTHGEMLPANAYPGLKKYGHLIGNYGTSWFNQQKEFEAFGGAILMTTNCIQKPGDGYIDKIFTTGLVGWPGTKHIADRKKGGVKDFSPVINKALSIGALKEQNGSYITNGFAHKSLLANAEKVVSAVKAGSIKRFVVMAGCDGRHKERVYFSDTASKLPADTVILTAGCAKYRYNMLDLGDIGGIPRVLDAGQCNDSYSLVIIAKKLAEAFGADHINDLPLSFDIAWYEQKAVCVLLALLHLGVKGIRLGPTLPAFISPVVLNTLVQAFSIRPITTPDNAVAAMMRGE